MKLGKLTIQFYREGFQDFEKFQDAVREFMNRAVVRIGLDGAMPHTPFFRRTRYATVLYDKRNVSN